MQPVDPNWQRGEKSSTQNHLCHLFPSLCIMLDAKFWVNKEKWQSRYSGRYSPLTSFLLHTHLATLCPSCNLFNLAKACTSDILLTQLTSKRRLLDGATFHNQASTISFRVWKIIHSRLLTNGPRKTLCNAHVHLGGILEDNFGFWTYRLKTNWDHKIPSIHSHGLCNSILQCKSVKWCKAKSHEYLWPDWLSTPT